MSPRARATAIASIEVLLPLLLVALAVGSEPSLAAASSIASVTGAIVWPDPSVADPSSLELRLTPLLDGNSHGDSSPPSSASFTTWPRASDGLFAFHGVPRGRAYSLDVSSPSLVFPRVLVEVKKEKEEREGRVEDGSDQAPFRAWLVAPLADVAAAVGPGNGGTVTAPRDPTATSTAVPLPLEDRIPRRRSDGETTAAIPPPKPLLVLRPTASASYFEAPQPFNLVAFLKTPYGMLIGFVIFAVFALPRMKIDPEEYEELLAGAGAGGGGGGRQQEQQQRLSGPGASRRGGAAASPPSQEGLRQRRP